MSLTRRKVFFYFILLAPGLFFLLLFTYTPLVRAIMDSMHDYRIVTDGSPFVGLENYRRLFDDANFIAALKNNSIYIVFTVIPGMVLSLLLALALQNNHVINRFLRAAFFFPTIVPLVAAATLWSFIFLPGIGLFDYYLSKLVTNQAHNFLGHQSTALGALIIIGIWKFAGYYMLFFLAGLQGIPDDAMEAAQIEGASKLQCFFNITLPLLRPTISCVGSSAGTRVPPLLQFTIPSSTILALFILKTIQKNMISDYLIYLILAVTITAIPGPAVILTIKNSIKYGFKYAVVNVLGNFVAMVILASLSAVGLGAVILASSTLYSILKIIGCLYLMYLGVMIWKAPPFPAGDTVEKSIAKRQKIFTVFKEGFGVGITNPKAIAFFTALFPQFIDPTRSYIPQFMTLILTIEGVSIMVLSAYAFAASSFSAVLAKNRCRTIFNKLTAVAFIGFGLALLQKE